MRPPSRLDRLIVVLRVLLALAVCALLALLGHDVLLPRLAGSPVPAAASASGASLSGAAPASGSPAPTSALPPAPSPSGDAVTGAEVEAAVDAALDGAPGTATAQVRDLATGEVLYSRGADGPVAPASAVKILTAAAVVRALGPDSTLTTSVAALPSPAGGTELVLVGGGDALLGTGASDPSRVDGRAGLDTLARLTVQGLRERGVTGRVRVSTDLRLFEDASALNPAWSEGAVSSGNITAVEPLATYGGRRTPGTGEDRIADPAGYAALTFQSALEDAVAASGADLEVAVQEEVPATAVPRADVLAAEPVARVESAPVREQVAYLLAHSENQVAETLAHTAAAAAGRPATHAGAAALVGDAVGGLGVDDSGLSLVDASGLSAQDRVSPAQLSAVVVALRRDPELRLVLDALPRPGEDSTLADRFAGTAAEDAVAAKTGTLDQTVSLTGTVTTAHGRALAFSIVCSEVDWAIPEARAAIDAAVTRLAEL